MAKSIFDVKPHQVSKDLSSYSFLIYGDVKTGKTTLASHFPSPLLLAFERGYSALPGVMAINVDTWSELKKFLRELKKPSAHELYKTIVFDTIDIAYNLCEKYIINNYDPGPNVDPPETIGDIPYGQGYKFVEKEFDEAIRSVINQNYGIVLISHSRDKIFKDEHNKEYTQIVPSLENKGKLVCERNCDIIAYARNVGQSESEKNIKLFLRGCERFSAGGRFKYIDPCIDMSYESLMKAISDAIDKEAEENNGTFITDNKDESKKIVAPQYDFNELISTANKICASLIQEDRNNAITIKEIISSYLGQDKKLANCTEKQADIVYQIVEELKSIKVQ